MLKYLWLIFALFFWAGAAQAQQRTLDPLTPGKVVRQWPAAGKWFVVLAVSKDRKLGCTMATAFKDESGGEFYIWGFSKKGPNFRAFISDKNRSAVEAIKIRVLVDGLPVGSFDVTERDEVGGFHIIRATIDDKAQGKITNLLRIGGELKFATDYANYATPLEGTGQALFHLNMCEQEATALMAARE